MTYAIFLEVNISYVRSWVKGNVDFDCLNEGLNLTSQETTKISES